MKTETSSSITKISCDFITFYKYWLQFTFPMHKLINQDQNILAYILRKKQVMTEMSSGMDIDKYLFSQETRNEIIKEAGVNANAFSVTLTRLRKAGILLADNKINPKIIPDLKRGCKKFDFIIIFDINRDDVE